MKIIEAYKCISHELDEKTGNPFLIYTWKYEDGTGNGMSADCDSPLWFQGVPFEEEPSDLIDECYYNVENIHPSELPACSTYDLQVVRN